MGEEEGLRGRAKRRVNLIRSLRDVIEDAERLEKELQRLLLRTGRLLSELYAIERAVAEAGAPRRPGPIAPVHAGPPPVLHDFRFADSKKGKSTVIFDGGQRFVLPRTLAELMSILADGEGESPDELAAWTGLGRLCELMEERVGRNFENHGISQLLWRLRNALKKGGLDPRLIESSARLGARLRLKRRSTGLCTS